jgi:hypothetical protein
MMNCWDNACGETLLDGILEELAQETDKAVQFANLLHCCNTAPTKMPSLSCLSRGRAQQYSAPARGRGRTMLVSCSPATKNVRRRGSTRRVLLYRVRSPSSPTIRCPSRNQHQGGRSPLYQARQIIRVPSLAPWRLPIVNPVEHCSEWGTRTRAGERDRPRLFHGNDYGRPTPSGESCCAARR